MYKFMFSVFFLPPILFGGIKKIGEDVDLQWLGYPSFCKPYRMDDLDGPTIVRLSKEKTAIPLLFPRLVSPLEWIDAAETEIYSLEELCRNPSLKPPVEQYVYNYKSPFRKNNDIWNESFKKSSQKISPNDSFDITRLINANSKKLPGNDQVLNFLKENKVELSSEEKQKILENLFSEEEQKDFIAQLLQPNLSNIKPHGNRKNGDSNSSGFQLSVPVIEIPEAPLFPIPSDEAGQNPNTSTLKLKATKSSSDGNPLPAQASEFYVTTKNLHELFKDLGADQALEGEIKSVAAIWANAEKSSNPEVVFGVKSILLKAKVGKTRTDAFGRAALVDLQPSDKYFLIGIEKDDISEQVTIWSKEVQVNPGENMIELSAKDVIYQE